jgi:hypothetical protein
VKIELSIVALAVALSGCTGSKGNTVPKFSEVASPAPRHAHNVTNESPPVSTYTNPESERVIQVGDFLLITFDEPPRRVQSSWGPPFIVQDSGLPAFDQQVKKDGAIRLLFNWEFNAVGKKTRDLEKEIQRCYVPEKFDDLRVGIRISNRN